MDLNTYRKYADIIHALDARVRIRWVEGSGAAAQERTGTIRRTVGDPKLPVDQVAITITLDQGMDTDIPLKWFADRPGYWCVEK